MLVGQRASYNRDSRLEGGCLFSSLAESLWPPQAWGDLGGLWAGEWEAPEGWGSTNPPEPESPLWNPGTLCPTPHSPGAVLVRKEEGCKGNGWLAYLVNELPDRNLNCEKQFSLLLISVSSFISLVTSVPPYFRNNWGKAWSDLSSAPLNGAPRKQFASHCSRSVFSFQTIKQEHISSPRLSLRPQQQRLTGRGGGRRKAVNLFHAPDHRTVSREIKEGLNVETPESFQMYPPALLFILPLKQFGRKGCEPYFFLEPLSLHWNQTRGEQEVWSKQAAYPAAHTEDTEWQGWPISYAWV